MLVLQRKVHQSIVIGGGEIVIRLIEAANGKARLGIEAPRNVRVDREEIHLERQSQRRFAKE